MRIEARIPQNPDSSIEYAVVCVINQLAMQSYAKAVGIDLALQEAEPYKEAQAIIGAFKPLLARARGDVKRTAELLKEAGATGKRLLIIVSACAVLCQRVVSKVPEKKLPFELLIACFDTISIAEIANVLDLSRVPPFVVELYLLDQHKKMIKDAEAAARARELLNG